MCIFFLRLKYRLTIYSYTNGYKLSLVFPDLNGKNANILISLTLSV